MNADRSSRTTLTRIAMAVPAALLAVSLVACGGSGRPSVDDVAVGFEKLMTASGNDSPFSEKETKCMSQALVDSKMSSEDLQAIADGKDKQATTEGTELLRTVLTEAKDTCVK